jgi:capsular exopolysaccharide synthesis family protein
MSRIFDALQRSEGERKDNDDPAVPEGPELLQRAEHRLVSKLETAAAAREQDGAKGPDGHNSGAQVVTLPDGGTSRAHVTAADSEHRLALFARVKALSISVPPESRLVCITDRESPTAEAVRLLGVRLKDLRRIRPLKKVLVTSTIPREGKTTIAANLACALAHGSDERVLLIEGDMRLPALRQRFGIGQIPGISELVSDGRKLQDCIYRLDGAGIWIFPAGRIPQNPLEILQSQRLPLAMDELAQCFEWIVIDSPPVLPLADTSIWMRLADGILLVTRQGVTERQQLQKGIEALEPQKMLGALLNGSIASAYSGYYYRTPSKSDSV